MSQQKHQGQEKPPSNPIEQLGFIVDPDEKKELPVTHMLVKFENSPNWEIYDSSNLDVKYLCYVFVLSALAHIPSQQPNIAAKIVALSHTLRKKRPRGRVVAFFLKDGASPYETMVKYYYDLKNKGKSYKNIPVGLRQGMQAIFKSSAILEKTNGMYVCLVDEKYKECVRFWTRNGRILDYFKKAIDGTQFELIKDLPANSIDGVMLNALLERILAGPLWQGWEEARKKKQESLKCKKGGINRSFERENGSDLSGSDAKNLFTQFIKYVGDADVFRSIDNIFVQSNSYSQISDSLSKNKPVVLLGHSGDGKSYTACHLMFQALKNGKKVKYIKGPSQFIGYFAELNNILAVYQTLMPENGFLFLDDPWGCDEEPTASCDVANKIINLCNRAESKSCSLIIASQKGYLPDDQYYLSMLSSAGVNIFDFSDPATGFSAEKKQQVYLNLINLRDAERKKPLRRNNLESEGAALVAKSNMNLFEVEMWASNSLLANTRNDLEKSALLVLSDFLYPLINSKHFSEDHKTVVSLLSFMNGALISDIQKEWHSIISGTKDTTNQAWDFSLWKQVFILREDHGEERLEFRHSIVAKYIDESSFQTYGTKKIITILQDIMSDKKPSIRRAGVKCLFRLGAFLRDSIWDPIDYVLNVHDDVMLSELTYQLGMLIEKQPSSRAIDRMKLLFYVDSQPVIHEWIKTVIRGWERMPEELKEEINVLLSPPISKIEFMKAKENVFEEIIVQMSKRVDIFYERLVNLVTHHRRYIRPYALEIIRGFCLRMDVSEDDVIRIVEPLMGVPSWSDRSFLKEELLRLPDSEMHRRRKLVRLINKFQHSYTAVD